MIALSACVLAVVVALSKLGTFLIGLHLVVVAILLMFVLLRIM